jgi:hypothetical protein
MNIVPNIVELLKMKNVLPRASAPLNYRLASVNILNFVSSFDLYLFRYRTKEEQDLRWCSIQRILISKGILHIVGSLESCARSILYVQRNQFP